jgi:hypothetical protein
MARQRELKMGKARRTSPIARRGRTTIRSRMQRETTYSDPDRMSDAQVEARNRAMAAALGRSEDRGALASYSAAAHRHSKALARKARKPRRATKLKTRSSKKTTGKRRSSPWVYVKAHRRHRPS